MNTNTNTKLHEKNMKIGFIFVLYRTAKAEVARLKLEVGSLKFKNCKIYFIDNTKNNRGYAGGVNEGIKQALIDNCDLLIVGNPDISLKGITANRVLAGSEHFDVWGFAMRMHGKTYYGGEIDRLHLSGGLIETKPEERFVSRDLVSGSLLIIKREVVKSLGNFDESYFMYYEDVDYCLRARNAGFGVGIDSKIIYDHFEISSGSPGKDRLLSQARQKFLKKYGNIWQKIYGLVTDKILKQVQDDQKGNFFLFSFFSLNLSSFINKLLNFILFIFLIRYLRPEEYGIYALVWAQVSIFSPLVDLGTTSYGIVDLPTERKEKFISLFNLRLIVTIVIFFLTVLAGSIMFKGNIRIVRYIFLTSFVIFSNMLSGSYLIKNAVQGKLYNSSLVSIIFNSLLIFGLIASITIFGSLPVIFIIIFIFYNLYSFANYLLVRKGFKKFSFSIDATGWKKFLRKSYVYILISFFAGLYFKIDVFLLQILKGETEVGIYTAGYKFFEALLFLAASYNITRTPIFAKLIKKNFKLLLTAMKKDLVFLAFTGISGALVIFFLSPIVLPFFLKGNYISSLKVVRIVIFGLPLILISSVFLNAIYVLKKAHIIVIIFLFQILFNFLLNLFFIPRYSYIASSYITVLSEFINVVLLSVTFFAIGRKSNYENIS